MWDETLEHTFVCDSKLNFPNIVQNSNMACISGDFSQKRLRDWETFRQIFHIPRRTAESKEGYIFIVLILIP